MALAHMNNCMVVNLSELPQSRLLFPRVSSEIFPIKNMHPLPLGMNIMFSLDMSMVKNVLQEEASLGYIEESGRYWESEGMFDPAKLSAIDSMWRKAFEKNL